MTDATRIRQIVTDSLFKKEELEDQNTEPGKEPPVKIPEGALIGNGIVNQFAFHPERLESHRKEIIHLLRTLPAEFMKTKGGGMTFLHMPFNFAGRQWGEQVNASELCAIGSALGLVEFPLPKELWSALPGSVPYVVVRDDKF